MLFCVLHPQSTFFVQASIPNTVMHGCKKALPNKAPSYDNILPTPMLDRQQKTMLRRALNFYWMLLVMTKSVLSHNMSHKRGYMAIEARPPTNPASRVEPSIM